MAACLLTLKIQASEPLPTNTAATALVHRALQAQGGEAVLRAVHSVQFEAMGYRNELEQSERPEGPYVTEFDSVTEVHDYAQSRYRSTLKGRVPPAFQFTTSTVVVDTIAASVQGGQMIAGNRAQVEEARETLALSPERLLITALDAPDLHLEPDMTLQSVTQHVLAFTLDTAPVRVYLNAYTLLPTAMDYSGPLARSGFWRFLGDVTMRSSYSFWWLCRNGIHLPMQVNVEKNGLSESMLVIQKLQIDAPLDEAALTIPDTIRKGFRSADTSIEDVPLGKQVQELAPGIVLFQGSWNVTLIRQPDGIVVLEAPISSGYSRQVIDEASRRFPGVPIKAVVTTSDSWPHIAGLREYAARSIPIYALDLNRPALERLLATPRTSRPDSYARTPRKATFHLVKETITIGSGPNRIELHPLRGETSERQMLAYFRNAGCSTAVIPSRKTATAATSFPRPSQSCAMLSHANI